MKKYKAQFIKRIKYITEEIILNENEMKKLMKTNGEGFFRLDNGVYRNVASFMCAKLFEQRGEKEKKGGDKK
ncbi:MAG: hypothetical protein V1922_00445 [bacterium]